MKDGEVQKMLEGNVEVEKVLCRTQKRAVSQGH